jgi:hypothetical protein
LGVDYLGAPVVDPTENVLQLTEAAVQRQDDLRMLTQDLTNAKLTHLKEISDIREHHQRELDHAESQRLDSIRQVDREEVAKSAATIQTATAALANQTTVLAETLRTQVGTVASAAEARAAAVANAADNRLNQFSTDVIKRISALELSLSEGKGKQQVIDPQLTEMIGEMRALRNLQVAGVGKTEGISLVGALMVGGVSLVFGLLGIAGIIYGVLKP